MWRDRFKRFTAHPTTAKAAVGIAIAAVLLLLVFLVGTVISMSHDLNRSDQRLDHAQSSRAQIRTDLDAQRDALDKANQRLRAAGKPTVAAPTPTASPSGSSLLPGPAGPRGPEGPAGPHGARGATGKTGAAGEQGARGPGPSAQQIAAAVDSWCSVDARCRGPQGDTGEPGPKGDTGKPGATGVAGPKGDTGAQGPVGDTGPAGPAGAKGDTGSAGPQGPPGKDGTPGKDATFTPFTGGCKANPGQYVTGLTLTRDDTGALTLTCAYAPLPTASTGPVVPRPTATIPTR